MQSHSPRMGTATAYHRPRLPRAAYTSPPTPPRQPRCAPGCGRRRKTELTSAGRVPLSITGGVAENPDETWNRAGSVPAAVGVAHPTSTSVASTRPADLTVRVKVAKGGCGGIASDLQPAT